MFKSVMPCFEARLVCEGERNACGRGCFPGGWAGISSEGDFVEALRLVWPAAMSVATRCSC